MTAAPKEEEELPLTFEQTDKRIEKAIMIMLPARVNLFMNENDENKLVYAIFPETSSQTLPVRLGEDSFSKE